MVVTGVLIAVSLRTGARLEGVTLTVRRITREKVGGRPRVTARLARVGTRIGQRRSNV